MKSKIVIPGFFFVFSIVNFSNAQIGNIVRSKTFSAAGRAQQQTDKEIDKKINKAVDTAVYNIFNKKGEGKGQPDANQSEPVVKEQSPESPVENSSGKGSGNATNDAMSRAMMSRMGISMERPANIKDRYDYTGNLLMTVQTWDEEGDTEGEVLYTTHYTNDNKGVAMNFKSKDKGNSKMIFDNDNHIMIILGDNGKDKSGFVMAMAVTDSVSSTAQASATETNNTNAKVNTDYYSNFKKTGRTKTIAGYSCEEFVYEDAENKASYWITNDMPADLWAKMFSGNMITSVYAGRPDGFIMESTNEMKNSKGKSTMVVKEVNKNQPASISTLGYTFVSYGGKPGSPK